MFALAMVAVALWIARNVWRGGLGRHLRALRDNEDSARAFTVPAVRAKVTGFIVSGFLAGIGGAVLGHALSLIGPTAFPMSSNSSETSSSH